MPSIKYKIDEMAVSIRYTNFVVTITSLINGKKRKIKLLDTKES